MKPMVRELAFGLASVAVVMWLTFFAGPGSVEVATMAAAAVALIWFATVEAERLVDDRGRPHVMLFGLAALGGALLLTAATMLSSGTTFLTLAIGAATLVTGLVRALRHGLVNPNEEA
ncbi:MAG TPA: hypothetical protein VJ938_12795 [Acidimicrobiia bacterium]|nr:hypothetical protein [Acidimicrobiia bacterium]